MSERRVITTNSITQTFNRKVLDLHLAQKKPTSIVFAIPDHPWVDSADGAAVKIAMTVGKPGPSEGLLRKVVSEFETDRDEREVIFADELGLIHSDLKVGANIAATVPLKGNEDLDETYASTVFEKLLKYMEMESPYTDSSVSAFEVAKAINTPPAHLSKVLRYKLNQSFTSFINGYRVEKIKVALEDPEYSEKNIINIAFKAGFNSKSAFNVAFKKATGMTPREYRKQFKNKLI